MLTRHPIAILSVVLGLQAVTVPFAKFEERVAPVPMLETLPDTFGEWKKREELKLDPLLLEYLKPDSYAVRNYSGSTGKPLSLVVAYFKSLQSTYAPHSPKHCLPGAGWTVRSSGVNEVPFGGKGLAPVNVYTLEKGRDQMVVVYWYQNSRRVWASEIAAKFYLLPDLIRYRQSDVALVRITVPVPSGAAPEKALETALAFMQLLFPSLNEKLAEAQV